MTENPKQVTAFEELQNAVKRKEKNESFERIDITLWKYAEIESIILQKLNKIEAFVSPHHQKNNDIEYLVRRIDEYLKYECQNAGVKASLANGFPPKDILPEEIKYSLKVKVVLKEFAPLALCLYYLDPIRFQSLGHYANKGKKVV